MKVALYARVSTEQQIENYSIALQLERIKAYCKSRGWENVIEYVDPGYSGSNLDRPQLKKLLNDLSKLDVVVVYKLDRLSRSQKDTLHLIEDCFLESDVEFISISETLDTSTPFGRAMIGILSVFAQLERETITERLKSGRLKMVKEHGYWAGGADANPTGYIRFEKGKLEINKEEADLVKKVFDEYLNLQSISKIQTKFKKEGLPVWRFNRYVRILKNRLYIGEVSFGDETYQGSHEPLVSKNKFDRVQKLLEKNKGKNYGKVKESYLTSKIVCEHCGNNYVSYSATDKLKSGKKVKYKYYMCKQRRFPKEYDSKCYNKTWNKNKLEDEIFTLIENLTIDNFKKKKEPPINYEKLINDLDNKISKTLDLYLDGIIEKDKLDDKVASLKEDREKLIEQKNNSKNNVNKEAINLLSQNIDIRNSSNEDKFTIINTLINKIYIDNEEILVEWNI